MEDTNPKSRPKFSTRATIPHINGLSLCVKDILDLIKSKSNRKLFNQGAEKPNNTDV